MENLWCSNLFHMKNPLCFLVLLLVCFQRDNSVVIPNLKTSSNLMVTGEMK